MSYVVIGYTSSGHRIVRDDGPARARVSGVGGAALGQVLAAPVKPGKPKRLPRQPAKRYKPDCGFAMPRGSVCARYPHRDHHHRAAVGETLA